MSPPSTSRAGVNTPRVGAAWFRWKPCRRPMTITRDGVRVVSASIAEVRKRCIWLAVSVFGLLAVAAALLAGLSAVDDGASDEASLLLLAGAISAGLLAVGAAILRALRRAAIVERPRAPDDLWQR